MVQYLGYPYVRGQRLKSNENLRELVSQYNVSINDLVMPIFVTEDSDENLNILKMPGIKRIQIKNLEKVVENLVEKGIKAVAIFPKVEESKKSTDAKEVINPNNLICRCLKLLSKKFPKLPVICDIALDAYTLSGQDGLIDEDGLILNDLTVSKLIEMSLNFADSGAKVLAPSDMMDGRVKLIRKHLEENKFHNVCILSYSAKFCSELYKPFREALGSEKYLGSSSKETYQIDVRNSFDAFKRIQEDINEGADIVMIKPASFYLDIIKKISDKIDIPIAAYQVSGEYYMIKNASENGIFNYNEIVLESLNSIKRAGANIIFTYFAEEVSEWLK